MRELVTTQLAHVNIQIRPPEPRFGAPPAPGLPNSVAGDAPLKPITPEQQKNTRRNEQCPCGSGKKFKHCHGSF
jgi:preprotein translocase subunit SecA